VFRVVIRYYVQLLKSPCHIDLSFRVDKFNRPTTKRSEAWLFIEEVAKVSDESIGLWHVTVTGSRKLILRSFRVLCRNKNLNFKLSRRDKQWV